VYTVAYKGEGTRFLFPLLILVSFEVLLNSAIVESSNNFWESSKYFP
jgi:hypothetical protein